MRVFANPLRRARRTTLSVETLEGRVVPAGSISATLSATGVLKIIGDEFDNIVTVKVTGTDVTITPDLDTAVNNTAPGTPVTLPGVVKSVRANLKSGSDSFSIDGTSPFQITGPLTVILGDGNNTLDLETTAKFQVAALTVRGGDGLDTVTVKGGTGQGSQVLGATVFSYANGGSSTTLTDMKFGVGVSIVATDAGGIPNEVTGTNVTTVGPVVAAMGTSQQALVTFTDSKLGGFIETGFSIGANLVNTTVKGGVIVRAGYEASLQVDGATVTGSVAVAGPSATLVAGGSGTTVNGNLTMTGSAWTNTSFQTTTLSQVKGAVMVTGGWFSDAFISSSQFKVGKSATLNLRGGDNLVSLGDGSARVDVGVNLVIRGGAGVDTVVLDRVAVAGAASIFTLSGSDTLVVDNGSSFATTFTANLGTGDDTILIAQTAGAVSPVTFTGTAKILAGAGNDSMFLGLIPASGGDNNTGAVFNGLGNVADGGLDIDFFDPAEGQYSGVTPIGW